jgi:hypothetical protein
MNTSQGGRWAIYIDTEGFGALYPKEDQILLAFRQLMEGIFLVGSRCFPESPERLFVHQLGDGFVIVSEFPENTLSRAVGVAVALLRHVSQAGRFATACIAEGQFADIHSCYPKTVLAAEDESRRIAIGHGVMTLLPVMGTALIRAVAVDKRRPKGPLLAIGAADRGRLPAGLRLHDLPERNLTVVDWVNSEYALSDFISKTACLSAPSPQAISQALKSYCKEQELSEEWGQSVNNFLSLKRS